MVENAKRKLLLIGWDAADWQHIHPLLDEGKLPVLQSLIERGVMGNLASLQPVLSPMLWTSVATGKQAWKHGVLGFMEPDSKNGGARAWSSATRRSKALWNILSQTGFRSNVVNWWASHPAESIRGCVVSNLVQGARLHEGRWQFPTRTTHPPQLIDSLVDCIVHPAELSGDELLPFVPDGAAIDQDKDHRLSMLAKNLAEMLTTHNLATRVMESTEWDFMTVYYTAIDHFCHGFVQYHPPKLPWIPQEDFDRYRHVIESTYRFSDMTLGRLLELAGENATVILCSDHGFQSGDMRLRVTPNEPAGPAYWHRKYGVFIAAGPGVRADERVYGATLLDIAPTILELFGLPAGEDMDGRVLTEIFAPNALKSGEPLKRIPSWEDVESNESGEVFDYVADPADSDELEKQFIALGYVQDAQNSKEAQSEIASTEAKFNLGRNLLWCRRFSDAVDVFVELARRHPWEDRFLLHLCRALLTSQRYAEAYQLLTNAYSIGSTHEINARTMWCETLLGLKRFAETKTELRSLEKLAGGHANIWLQIGNMYQRLRNSSEAEWCIARALDLNSDHAEAQLTMSTILLRQSRYSESAEHALNSIFLVYNQPRAHLNLGLALLRTGDVERSEVALQAAVRIAPGFRRAHRVLAAFYRQVKPDSAKAGEHSTIQSQLARSSDSIASRVTQRISFDWSIVPSESDRKRLLAEYRPQQTNPARPSGKTFVIVSGLPRSGTSLMMQMLQLGGMQTKTDQKRKPDDDNPAGYFEWEEIQQVGRKPQVMDEPGLDQMAIKAVTAILPQLPYQHYYEVIFMDRPIQEVVISQQKMVSRLQTQGSEIGTADLARELATHRSLCLQWLQQHPRADVLVVRYQDLLTDSEATIQTIVDFLGSDRLPNASQMRQAIRHELYRNRDR